MIRKRGKLVRHKQEMPELVFKRLYWVKQFISVLRQFADSEREQRKIREGIHKTWEQAYLETRKSVNLGDFEEF